jgi:cbb3-type cytochrome oxidase subunit 1
MGGFATSSKVFAESLYAERGIDWIIGAHVHIALIVGLYMTLYSAVYVLWPIVTNNTKLFSSKLSNAHYWLHLIGGLPGFLFSN